MEAGWLGQGAGGRLVLGNGVLRTAACIHEYMTNCMPSVQLLEARTMPQ